MAHHLPPEVATIPSSAELLRISNDGGTARLYDAATLAPRDWVISQGLPDIARVLGSSAEARSVYAADARRRLVAIDLVAHRAHMVPTPIEQFLVAPDGTLLGLDTARHPVRFSDRSVTTYGVVLRRGALLLRGPGDELLTVGNRPGQLQVINEREVVRHLAVPTGRVTATWVGDLVAVTTDSGIALVDVTGRHKPAVRFVRLTGHPIVSAFSPSGHRLYVADRAGRIIQLDRFSRKRLDDLSLPAPAEQLRVDRTGRWLMAQGPGEALWVVDLAKWHLAASLTAPWADDLPQVADGRTLLVRDGKDLVATNLEQPPPRQRVVLKGGGDDRYIMLPWVAPRSPGQLASSASQIEPDPSPLASTIPASDTGGPPPAASATGTIYLQVSSSQNHDWAAALARQLKDGGFPASVLAPTDTGEGFRVVIGPYATRDQADAMGRRLGRSYFIVSPGGGTPP